MMKTLLVLRHAKSSWDDPRLADFDRPLNKRGKRDAPRMGELIRAEGLVPDLIISSSAKRALATAKLAAEASGYEGDIQTARRLYHAWPEEAVEVLNEVDDEITCVMIVGHNPGLEDFVDELTGEAVRLPTAALVQIELAIERWSQLSLESEQELVAYWRPKELS
jgi:phosphohistidine phosphatase